MKLLLRSTFATLGLALLPLGCRSPQAEAPLYAGFDGYHRPITTDSPAAQRLFDQGLQFLYGYNHDEAIRSFEAAAEADPDCALAYWGLAYANGLHINNPTMSEEQSRRAFAAAQEGLARIESASPVEQALLRAVATRYTWPAPEDRSALDLAYADAMEAAYRAFPEDAEVGALFAEALMDLQPWDLWTHDGEPKGRALEIVAVLEAVLERHPQHPGANHFYIHTVEASPAPERAVPSADRLVELVPGSGHLVHMPAHIYTRVGRYGDAVTANRRAIAADREYFARAPAPDFYTVYYVHNVHFLAYAAMMDGQFETALSAARQLEAEIPEPFLREYVAIADGLMPTVLHVLIRFGRFEEVLAEPDYPEYRRLSRAQRHYARAVALAALGRPQEARQEEQRFEELAAQVPADWKVGNNSAGEVLALCRQMMAGEILFREGRQEEAFAALERGVALEEALVYDEPPGWMQPVRHAQGALLMAAGRAADAEQTYRRDLERNPDNGWSWLGLELALRAQSEDASEATAARRRAFARADVQPTSSCYCEP
jgi:tetratricopeptide (TPR) repeat protein